MDPDFKRILDRYSPEEQMQILSDAALSTTSESNIAMMYEEDKQVKQSFWQQLKDLLWLWK